MRKKNNQHFLIINLSEKFYVQFGSYFDYEKFFAGVKLKEKNQKVSIRSRTTEFISIDVHCSTSRIDYIQFNNLRAFGNI